MSPIEALEPIDWSFEAPRIRGRLIDEGDIDLYQALYTDAAVMRHIGETMSTEAAAIVFAKAVRHNANPAARARYWHVSHRRTAQVFGLAALIRDAQLPTRGELGLMLLPKAQHTGIGVQVLTCVIDGALSQRWRLAMTDVLGRHAPGNLGAGRLIEHLGFERFDIGAPETVVWRTTADAWRARVASGASNRQDR
jgi:RimJ/RimL family protein N-acetyltransferase